MLNPDKINRINELKDLIQKWNQSYYELSKPEVSDEVYDAHYQELKELESQLQIINKKSPINTVGYLVNTPFEKIQHKEQMLSLENAFDEKDIYDWLSRALKTTELKELLGFVCEVKIDGLSLSLIYEKGLLKHAITRGDGFIGEDVTHNALTIRDIPKKIDFQEEIEVRGEVYMTYSSFAEFKDQGFANPRNLASGSMKLLDSKLCAERKLNFFAYTSPSLNKNLKTHWQVLEKLKELGFQTNPENKHYENIEEIIALCKDFENKREKFLYPIDGAVIKINSLKVQELLGQTAKYPRYAIAYKFKAEIAETLVENIEIEIGRTGILTPVANLLAVRLSGSTVKRATLHNLDYINNLDIRSGDYVKIRKAGEIIPEIFEVIKEKRQGHEKKFEMPSLCPSCGSQIIKIENESAFRCLNYEACPMQIQKRIEHWSDALEIKGLGESIVKKLLDKNLIKNIADLYKLNKEDFLLLEGFAVKSAENLYNAIQKSSTQNLEKIIYGLGIKGIGLNSAKNLVKNLGLTFWEDFDFFETIEGFEKLISIEGIGELNAKEIKNFFINKQQRILLKELKNFLKPIINQQISIVNKLNGLNIAITGSFNLARKEIQALIENNGGKFVSSISNKTDYLLAGEDSGSKLEKAKQLNIKILSWQDFEILLNY